MGKFQKSISELSSRDFYYCYDMECSKFLKKHGYSYLLKAKSVRDDEVFTMFIRSQELNELILKYKQLNNK